LTPVLPVSAFAQAPQCKHSQARNPPLDLGGVKTVMFDPGPHRVELDGSAGARSASH
jgi:hypothetical protein